MDSSVIVMIVTLSMPNGSESISVKPMETAETCRAEAQIEASDPFVADVTCSELRDGKLQLDFARAVKSKIPEAVIDRSTG